MNLMIDDVVKFSSLVHYEIILKKYQIGSEKNSGIKKYFSTKHNDQEN